MALKDDWITGDVYTAGDQNDVADEVNGKVPSSRTVSAGTGLTGGGDLSADRSLAVSYGTSAGTAAQGNDSRITGAVPTSRTVSAGSGLTGGGDLTANRTLAADFGSGAGKVCEGNDSRLSDARTPTSHTHAASDVSSGTLAIGRIPTGSSGSTVCIGNDSRLSDARTPTSHNHAASEVTSGTLDVARIPDLAASKITSGTLDAARIPAVTSSMITDGTIVNADIDASAAIVATKLAAGVQTSLGKADTATQPADLASAIATAQTVAINAQTGTTYTLVLGDASKAVECSNASAITLTVPPNASVAFPTGTVIEVLQVAAGQVTLAPGSGVTLNNANGLKTSKQWSAVTLRKRDTNVWLVAGDCAS